MCMKVPGVADRGCQPEPERKSLTLEYVNTKYPEDQWTHAYTDGSAAEATRGGGGGVYISYNDGKTHFTITTGKYSTNFKAEAEALKKRAATEIRNNLPQPKPSVVIFTDALRRDMWPEPTLQRDKLYGNLEELRRTAAFVRVTGISI